MDQTKARYAVIICTFRREQVLVETLMYVLAQSPAPDEVLVVDQTPEHEPATEAYLRAQHDAGRLRWLRQDRPSLCAARNRGVSETQCEIIHFLDDDVLLPENTFARHAHLYELDDVSALTQDILTSDDFDDRYVRDTAATLHELPANARREVDYLRGFNFSVRRDAYVRVGGFDENYVGPANYEESDFAKRLLESGLKIFTDPSLNVMHLKSPAGGCRIPGNMTHPEWTKSVNYITYAARYGSLVRGLVMASRAGPLRRENLVALRRWPSAWWNFAIAIREGLHRARSGIRSPFPRVR